MGSPFTVADLRAQFDPLGFALLLAAGVAAGVFALLFAWRWWASHPRLPDAGPETLDFGPEPPAIANLLVNRWHVTRSALGATLLDLCARRYLGMDQLDEEHFVIRVRDAAGAKGGELTPYERQVMDLVRSRATGGSCPVEALEISTESWWRRFADEVVKDSRKLGLSRSRWSRFDWAVLGGSLALPLALLGLSLGQAGIGAHQSANPDRNFSRWDWMLFAGVAWVAGMLAIGRLRDLRDTAAGQAACARWLGVREYFRKSHAFDHAPAASVVVWERNLSYGAALGVAHEAVRALPFEEESEHSAWTRYGGDWHEVRIRYPARFGSCQSPVSVLFSGLLRAAFFGGLAFVALPILVPAIFDVVDGLRTDAYLSARARLTIGLLLGGFLTVGAAFLTLRFLGGVIRIWRAMGDLLGKGEVIEGEVVKVYAGRAAVFDGRNEETVAWFPPPGAGQLSRGMQVRVVLTPQLHWVKRLEMLDGSPIPGATGVEAGEQPAARLGGSPVALGSLNEAVRQATGLPLAPATEQPAAEAGMQAFHDAAGNSVIVNGMRLPGGAGGALVTAAMQRGFPKESRVEGLGDAAWYRDGGLMVKRGDEMLIVRVELAGKSPDEELGVARQIAAAALAGTPATS